MKRDKYTCQKCGAKQSRAKGREVYVQIHHKEGICNWDALFLAVRTYLLCHPIEMVTLCEGCHEDLESLGKNEKVEPG